MITICEHIEYLLRNHDCVIVPGWGAFIAQYQPASFTEDGQMLPPSRLIGFNASISHQDGLLASSVMRREKISYDAASNKISTEVNALRHQFDEDGELALGRIGIFSKSSDGTVVFEPTLSTSIMGEFMSLLPVELEQPKLVEPEVEIIKRKDVIYVPVSRSLFRIAASLLLLILLGITLSTPVVLDDNASYASISTPKITAPTKVNPISEPAADAELFIAMPCDPDAVSIADTLSIKEYVASVDPTSKSWRCEENDAYCLIVASLASRELAEEYILERNESSLKILESSGKFRIYAATGATATQALEPTKNDTFSSKYPAAWVCRR